MEHHGNTGKAEHVPEQGKVFDRPRGGFSVMPAGKNTDGDMLVLGIMVLLYLESRDTDFLIIAAVLFFCFYKDSPGLKRLTGLLQGRQDQP